MTKDRGSSAIKAAVAIAAFVGVLGLITAGQIQAQAPTTTAPTGTTAIDMIHVLGGGTPCEEPMPAQLFIRWLNGVPPHEWPEDVFRPDVESVTIESGTVTTADGTTKLTFSPASGLDPSDPRAVIESSQFSVPGPPEPAPTYEIVYTVTYADGTTETRTYSRDIGIAVPAIGCPVPGPPTSEMPTTVPDGSGGPLAPGATPIRNSPKYTG